MAMIGPKIAEVPWDTLNQFGGYNFSTDWSLVPNMLAWLRERCGAIDTTTNHERTAACVMDRHDFPVGDWTIGDDMPEALARLVVAVSEMGEED